MSVWRLLEALNLGIALNRHDHFSTLVSEVVHHAYTNRWFCTDDLVGLATTWTLPFDIHRILPTELLTGSCRPHGITVPSPRNRSRSEIPARSDQIWLYQILSQRTWMLRIRRSSIHSEDTRTMGVVTANVGCASARSVVCPLPYLARFLLPPIFLLAIILLICR